MRKLLAIPAALALLVTMSAPVAADPPASSGAVVRFTDRGFGVFPDTTNGSWVFANIERSTFCAWFEAGAVPPPPMGMTDDFVQLVTTPDAEVALVKPGDAPIFLHAFAGTDPLADPCSGSATDPALSGDVHVVINDNDGPNMGKRANSFGQRGQATLSDADGNLWHYNFVLRIVFGPDENAPDFGIPNVTEHANLKLIGKG